MRLWCKNGRIACLRRSERSWDACPKKTRASPFFCTAVCICSFVSLPAARCARSRACVLSANATPALATAFCTWDALMSAFRASADMVLQISLLTKGTWSAAQLLGRKYLSNLSFSLSADSLRRTICSRYWRASQQRHRPFFPLRLDLCLVQREGHRPSRMYRL